MIDNYKPKVSIIVPVYNAERTLGVCLKSILRQTYGNLELLVINDGSKDKSLKICKAFKRKDSRIIILNKENEGVVHARKAGLERAAGEYIFFVDADDWIHENAIEALVLGIIANDADIVVCNRYKVISRILRRKRKNKSLYFKEEQIYTGDDIRKKLVSAYLHGHPFPACATAKLYKHKTIADSGKYLKDISFFGEDLFLNFEIFLKAKKVIVMQEAYYYYRMGGYTSKYMPKFFDDAVVGYEIQKNIIEEYFYDSKEIEMKGISVMLLNTLKTCFLNCIISDMSKREKHDMIESYISNPSVLEAASNPGAVSYMDAEFLDAIDKKKLEHLYGIGIKLYNKGRIKRFVMRLISFLRLS